MFVGYTFLEQRLTLSGSVGSTVRVTVSWAVIADMACPTTELIVQLSTVNSDKTWFLMEFKWFKQLLHADPKGHR